MFKYLKLESGMLRVSVAHLRSGRLSGVIRDLKPDRLDQESISSGVNQGALANLFFDLQLLPV